MNARERHPVYSIDPRDGSARERVASTMTADDVETITKRAETAFLIFSSWSRARRADLLLSIADELELRREVICGAAHHETAIPLKRLYGELTRSSYQARFFAGVLTEGSYLEATIDHAGPTPMGPAPDIRRLLAPLGPVAVFGSSNFPLAFSVPGGDTISALAAGCSVVVKAHSSHPATSLRCAEAIEAAIVCFVNLMSAVSAIRIRPVGRCFLSFERRA